MAKKVFPIGGKLGPVVFKDFQFVCNKCGEKFFFTSETMSKWHVERLHENRAARHWQTCVPCEEKANWERTKAFAEIRREKAKAKLEKQQKVAEQRNARTKRICVTITCDLCLVSNSQSYLTFSEARWPEGWKNLSAYPGEVLCPECIPETKSERLDLQDGINSEVRKVKRKLHEFYEQEKK